LLSRQINHSETVAKEAEIEKLSASIKQLEIVISQNKLNLEKCKTENNILQIKVEQLEVHINISFLKELNI
jgi:SMC interacting uncharacterized protein involved in chromosome segregation